MPSPISAYDLIASAFRKIGVLEAGETMAAGDGATGLQALNDVIETWNIEGLSLVGSLPVTFSTVAAQNTYTLGTGGNWSGQRPASITSAYCSVNGVDFPIGIWTLEEWMALPLKTLQQAIIERLVYVNAYPLGQVILYPTPSSVVTVTLNYESAISQVASVNTTLTLAPGYARALQYAVGQELQAEYGGSDVTAYARATKAILKRANRSSPVSSFDPTLTGGGVFIGARGY